MLQFHVEEKKLAVQPCIIQLIKDYIIENKISWFEIFILTTAFQSTLMGNGIQHKIKHQKHNCTFSLYTHCILLK